MSRYELDLQNPEKIPAPQLNIHIKGEIEKLLPRNCFGEPQLTVEWGMDATTFRNDDPKATKYVALHHVIKTTKWRRLDPVAGKYEYFDTRDQAVNALNIRLLPNLERKTTKEIRIFGPPRWHVVQWFPAAKVDSKENWKRNRQGSYYNKKGELVKFDALGPYPTRGQYREVFVVEGLEGEFCDLDYGVVTKLQAMLAEREIYNHNAYSDAQAIRTTVAEEHAKVALEEKRIEEEFEAEVGVSRYRLIEGNAFAGAGGTAAQAAGALKK